MNAPYSSIYLPRLETYKCLQFPFVSINYFIPFIMDTVGNIGKVAIDFLMTLSREVSKISKDDFVKCFIDGLQIVLYKGLSDQSVSFYQLIEESISDLSHI